MSDRLYHVEPEAEAKKALLLGSIPLMNIPDGKGVKS